MKIKVFTLVSPFMLITIPTLIQFILWLQLDGNNFFGLKRFDSYIANIKFLLFYFDVLFAIVFVNYIMYGKKINLNKHYFKSKDLKIFILFIFVLFIISELLYLRELFKIGFSIFDILGKVNVASYFGSYARSHNIKGLTTFTWSSNFLVAILAYLYFFEKKYKNFSKKLLIFVLIITFFHAFILGIRVAFIYSIFIIGFIYIYQKHKHKSINIIKLLIYIILLFFLMFVIFAIFEYFRGGVDFLKNNENGNIILYLFQRFVIPYLANNHQNALVYLSIDSEFTIVSSSPFFKSFFNFLGLHFYPINTIPTSILDNYTIPYGTVHIFGLLYKDLGNFGYIYIFLIVSLSQFLYNILKKDYNIYVLITYSIIVPGLLSFCRVNYFGNAAFMVPIILLLLMRVLFTKKEVKVESI